MEFRRAWAGPRSAVAGRDHTAAWCGHGVLAHYLVKITALTGSR